MATAAQAFRGMATDARPMVQDGSRILEQTPTVFPQQRPFRDGFFAFLFLIVFAIMAFVAVSEVGDIPIHRRDSVPFKSLAKGLSTTVSVAALLSLLFVWFTKVCTKLVVWGTLLFSPCVMLCLAAAAFFFRKDAHDGLTIAMCLGVPALLSLLCICCCQRLIPFTVEILREVATVTQKNLGIVYVGILGTFGSLAWMVLATAAVSGVKYSAERREEEEESMAIYFAIVVVLLWGVMVCTNTCHVTYCGIFGRWYFGLPSSVSSSYCTAITTSLGSICFGSLIIAVASASETVLRQLQRRALRERETNAVVLCVICCLHCMVACIKDIIEAISYFAFVQVAVRGVSFLDSARLTLAIYRFRNISAIIAYCLVGSVASLGAAFCGVVAGVIGSVVGSAALPRQAHEQDLAFVQVISLSLGVILGIAVAGNILYALRSGFATICMCWAEDSTKLGTLAPNLDHSFEQRIQMCDQS